MSGVGLWVDLMCGLCGLGDRYLWHPRDEVTHTDLEAKSICD